ncbi:cytochrome P450 [Nocardia stercoris]|uniref:Cytochrome P450 n=1 Tax=Nocardia stercoris TaxID=2483361 RepID=A0A3M2L351_9NOCA|nr:cytochrome P450 [Nocardia stercoris]RMI31406.1 cytochrome P450 [Nocardia stercoris]
MDILDDPYLFASDSPVDLGKAMAAVRREMPVYWDEVRQAWVVMRYADVDWALRNPQLFSNEIYDHAALLGTFSAMDGAAHAHHRRLFAPAFGPRAVAEYRVAVVEPVVERLVAGLRDRDTAELVAELCLPLPVEVIAPLLGLTAEYLEPCRLWVNQLVAWNMYRKDPAVGAVGRTAYDAVREHVRDIVERQAAAPQDNLLGRVVRAYQDAGVFDFDQMLIFAVGLVIGGFETTTWMTACALGALLLHPAALDEVRRDRSLLPAALEESMRWTPSFVGVLRSTTRAVTLSGVTIPAGADVVLCQASAHYDDEYFTAPEVFDIHRKPEHLLFAAGPHYCLGAPLARLEARTLVSRLLDELPGLRLVPGSEHPFVLGALGSAMHGPTALHVQWDRG